jgi:hypothetical protein
LSASTLPILRSHREHLPARFPNHQDGELFPA